MLSIQNLAHRYPGAAQAALGGISFKAERGQVLGLLGPNGAGKTTLISHLAGLLPIRQGQVLIDSEALDHVRRRDPTRIALAPQEYAFYPTLTVRENLACFAGACRLHGSRKTQRITTCTDFAQLARYADVRAEHLSGGLKRRLNLAIALLPEPELILLDEPTVGVDPQSRAFLLDAVKTLAHKGAAVIYTSHYMEEIEAIVDHVVIVDHGKVLRNGPLATLLAEGNRQLRLIIEGIDDQSLAIFGQLERQGDTLLLTLPDGQNPGDVLAKIEAVGGRIHQATFGRYNLEQLFMALTHRSLRDD
ncbi:UNVERIFIED_CONTAM: hypothetical protein B566_EDAN011675 [Ephemera danica]|nr:hypothetical protein B566_EDAN011675 [Ephemera danica]